jgi:hypothetical protein
MIRHELGANAPRTHAYRFAVRSIDLAVYADTLAGEAAALAARAERLRARLREATIERQARSALDPSTITRLQQLGLLVPVHEGAREELQELEESLAAVEELQSWVEARLSAEQVR